MTDYAAILRQHASPDVIAANPEYFDAEALSAAVSGGTTGHVSVGRTPLEAEDQQAVVDWCEDNADRYPGIENIYANVNGQYRKGERPEPGLKRGVPDLFLPVAVQHVSSVYPMRLNWYHGLYIELKRDGRQNEKPSGGLSPEQVDWIERLRLHNYYVAVAYGADEAIDVIQRYYEGNL